jgi:hypothetical protein
VTRIVLDDQPVGFNFPAGVEIFIFITVSKAPLGPTHHPVRFVSGALSSGIEGLEREAHRSFPSSVEVKIA